MTAGAVLRLLLAAIVLAGVAAGCGSDRPVARVADRAIAGERVEAILEHAEEEARHEGRVFPERGTPAYAQARREALDLVIYHEELATKAAQLGITVDDDEIEARLRDDGEEEAAGEEGEETRAFAEESMRAALLYLRLYQRVTGGIRVTAAETNEYYRRHARAYRARGLSLAGAGGEIARDLLTSKRTAAMARWVAAMRHELAPQVSYAKEASS